MCMVPALLGKAIGGRTGSIIGGALGGGIPGGFLGSVLAPRKKSDQRFGYGNNNDGTMS